MPMLPRASTLPSSRVPTCCLLSKSGRLSAGSLNPVRILRQLLSTHVSYRELIYDDLVARKCLQPAETRIGLQEVINIVEALEDQFSESVVGSVEDCMLCLVLLCLEMIRNGSSPILCCTVIMSSPAALGGQRTTRRPDVLPSHASASKVLSRPSGCLYIPQF